MAEKWLIPDTPPPRNHIYEMMLQLIELNPIKGRRIKFPDNSINNLCPKLFLDHVLRDTIQF